MRRKYEAYRYRINWTFPLGWMKCNKCNYEVRFEPMYYGYITSEGDYTTLCKKCAPTKKRALEIIQEMESEEE